jgi:signal transduction histidine kinase
MPEGRAAGRRWPGGRRWPLRSSVRVRITLAATLVTAAAVSLAGWLLVQSVEDTQLGDLRRRTEQRIDDVSDELARGASPQQAVQATPIGTFVEVIDAEGRPLAAGPEIRVDGATRVVVSLDGETTNAGAGGAEQSLPPELPPSGCVEVTPGGTSDSTMFRCPGPLPPSDELPGSPRVVGTTAVSQYPMEMVSQDVETADGTLTVRAAAPVDEVRRSVGAVRRGLVVGLPGLVLLVAGVAWALVGRALRPVEGIRSEVEAITGTTIHRRVPEPDADDEIGRLARTMNAMLARLEAAQVRQRQFVSDASHELRSPVTAIRSDLEVALHEGEAAEWPEVARAVLGEEARLERLLDDLLVLAATDETAPPPPSMPVDLAALLAEDAARGRRVPVRVRSSGDGPPRPPTGSGGRDGRARGPAGASGDQAGYQAVRVMGTADQLARVVANLVDNAARHARTTVEVAVEPVQEPSADNGTVRLVVDDDGPGIPPAERERVFERFTRLDEGRARNDGGTGLGLAVVRSIVARHRGRVWVEDAPLGGARLVVELPLATTGAR